jgi:hypothetical protein
MLYQNNSMHEVKAASDLDLIFAGIDTPSHLARELARRLDRLRSLFNQYETPIYSIGQLVTHKPTGKVCEVRGFLAFTPPIILYSLQEVGGQYLDECTSQTEMERYTP